MKSENIYIEYLQLIRELEEFERNKIPLCAAETTCSPFVRSALGGIFEGKYCMNHKNYRKDDDFIGSEYIHRLYTLLDRQCAKMFGSCYADARTLSGLNCITTVINCLLPKGSRVLLTTPEQGGHPSIPTLLGLAQVAYDPIPFDYDKFDLNYSALNSILRLKSYDAVILAQSDVLNPADVSRVQADGLLMIYDATQTLGMIATRVHSNPLDEHMRTVVLGGTHKTLPGPACGLILTNDPNLSAALDSFISPVYLRNTQPDHIAALLLALLEQEAYGATYQREIIQCANTLGEMLQNAGFCVLHGNPDKFTNTHQLFISTSREQKERILNHARYFGVTMNGKEKKLFRGHGVRLGLQEIAGYGWGRDELTAIAAVISQLDRQNPDEKYILWLKEKLSEKKNPAFSFKEVKE